MNSKWYVYILRCADNTLYTGITTDLDRRVQEHNVGRAGAKYTKARRPVALVYSEEAQDRSQAARRECELKKLARTEKLQLIQ